MNSSRLNLLAHLALCSALSSAPAALAGTVVIDSFNFAYTQVTAGGDLTTARNNMGAHQAGFSQYGLAIDSSILGGTRQVQVNDGHSGVLSSGLAAITVNTGTGLASLWGAATAMGQNIMYGSAIDRVGNGPGSPSPLNLGLLLTDTLQLDLLQFSDQSPGSFYVGVTLYTGAGASSYGASLNTLGTFSMALSSFGGLTPAMAADIDGIQFNFSSRASSAALGAQLGELRFVTASGPASVPDQGSMALLPLTLGSFILVHRILRRRLVRV